MAVDAAVNSALSTAQIAVSVPSTVPWGMDVPITVFVQSATGGPVPTGTVTLRDGSATITTGPLSGGSFTFMTRYAGPGSHTLVASYSGDSNYAAAESSPETCTVDLVRTQVLLSAVPGPTGKIEAIEASVIADAGTASGAVSLYEGTTLFATVTLNNLGVGYFYTIAFGPGSHTVTATYSGNANSKPSTSAPLVFQLGPSPTTTEITSIEPRQSTYGQPVTVRVRVSGNPMPAGSISVLDGASVVKSAALDANGQAVATLPLLQVGMHTLSAAYAGNAQAAASTSVPTSITVAKGTVTLTVSAAPSTVMSGQSVTLTAKVDASAGAPTGSVAFRSDDGNLATVGLTAQSATAIVSLAAAGQKTISATYSGDANFASIRQHHQGAGSGSLGNA